MSTSTAAASGTYELGGDLEVNRLGYSTMQQNLGAAELELTDERFAALEGVA
ncbi:MAG: hypothetical protein JST53_13845 [Actinobacteria bacterium]|nr:hypothetical protein [Actinomycetota bacterium]